MTVDVMEKVAGSVFGPYEIVAPLGSGGMGEVYRARDNRLHREVALKILTGEGNEDQQRQRRFLQEARAASALNHPNILTVYDVGSENGYQFIVSELVEGETLRSLIQKGPIPLRRFLEIAIQVASGLTAAHEAGIVHRDLKPENIMVGRDNRVKVLDFGLAKMLFSQTGSQEEQTRSQLLTLPGAILGTVAYMSPEQARGAEIDFRSDQFSFGIILYEMATGKQAFNKDTPVQTLSAIITEDPPSINELNKKFPAPMRWMIERCLSKDRRDRYGATIDLYHELRDFREHISEASFSGETAPSAPVRRKAKTGLLMAAGILSALAAGFLISAALRPEPEISQASYRFTPLAVNEELENFAIWSPDGNSVAYTVEIDGVQQLFTRHLQSPTAVQITRTTDDVLAPFWSPDGTRIYYTSKDKDQHFNLLSVGVAGGEPVIVVPGANGGTISPDGKTLAFFREDAKTGKGLKFWIASLPITKPKQYAEGVLAGKSFEYAEAAFSPDGSKILLHTKAEEKGKPNYWLVPYPSGQPQSLDFLTGAGNFGLSWMPDGKRFVFSSDRDGHSSHHLWMADIEKKNLKLITNGVMEEWSPAVSPDGRRLLFASANLQFDLADVPLDGSAIRYLTSTPVSEKAPAWSPGGKQFAFCSDITGSDVIWIRSQAEGWQRPLVTQKDFTDGLTDSFSRPFFSPDGRSIVYHRNTKMGKAEIWISSIAGGSPVRLNSDARSQFTPSWSPDGNSIAFLMMGDGGKYLLALSRVGSSNPPTILKDSVVYFQPQWSPDGAWIVYQKADGVYLIATDGKSEKQLGKGGWLTGGWSKDGKTLYSIQKSDTRRLLVVATDAQTGAETLIADAGVSPILITDSVFAGFALAPDGKSITTSILRTKADLWILEDFDSKPRTGILDFKLF